MENNLLALAIDAARAKATRRGDLRRAREGVRASPGRDPDAISGVYRDEAGKVDKHHQGDRTRRAVRRGRGPSAPRPDRQDGPGRPRPRPEGDRHGLRRHRLRRRRGTAVPDPGGGRQAGGRQRRARGRCVLAGGGTPHAGARRCARRSPTVGRPDIMVVVGGVIPPGDFDELYEAGAAAIFPPGTVIADAAIGLLEKVAAQLGHDFSASGRREPAAGRRRRPRGRDPGRRTRRRSRRRSRWSSRPGPTTATRRSGCCSPCCPTPGARTASVSPACPGSASRRSSTRSACI